MSWEKHDAARVYKTPILTEYNKRSYVHIADTQWAYLAGIIDGEGCIHIRHSKYKKTGAISYCLTITVSNTDASMIKWLHKTFEGSYARHRGFTSKHREVWSWRVASQEAEEICKGILPYLTAKKDQAETALMFRETYYGYRMRSQQPVDPDLLRLRVICYEDMKEMKRKPQRFQ